MSLTVLAIAAIIIATIAGVALVAALPPRRRADPGLAEAEATIRAAIAAQYDDLRLAA